MNDFLTHDSCTEEYYEFFHGSGVGQNCFTHCPPLGSSIIENESRVLKESELVLKG